MVKLTCPVPCYVDGKPWQTDDVEASIALRLCEAHIKLVHEKGKEVEQIQIEEREKGFLQSVR